MAQRQLFLTFSAVAARVSIILVSVRIDATWFANRQLCYLLSGWLALSICRLLGRLRHHFDVDEDAIAGRLTVLLVVVVALGRIRTTPRKCLQAHVQTKLVFLLHYSMTTIPRG